MFKFKHKKRAHKRWKQSQVPQKEYRHCPTIKGVQLKPKIIWSLIWQGM